MQALERLRTALSIIIVVAAPMPASAHDMAKMGRDVGRVHLATSCSRAAATAIDHGTAYLYSFMYDAARRSFREAQAAQPGCAMAWWGEAMSYWQQIERLPEGSMREAGWMAIARARAAPIQNRASELISMPPLTFSIRHLALRPLGSSLSRTPWLRSRATIPRTGKLPFSER